MKQLLYVYIFFIFLSPSLFSAEDTLLSKIYQIEDEQIDYILKLTREKKQKFSSDSYRLAIIQCHIDGFETFLRESYHISSLDEKTDARIYQFLLNENVPYSNKEYYVYNIGSLLSKEQAGDLYKKLHILNKEDFTIGSEQDLIDIEHGKTPETITRKQDLRTLVSFLSKRSVKIPSLSFSQAFDFIESYPYKLSNPIHDSYPGCIARGKGGVVYYE